MNEPELSGAASVWRVERIASIAQLERHRAAYDALLCELSGAAARYYTIEALHATEALFVGRHDQVFFLLAWQDAVLRGVAPLLLEARRWPRPRRLHAWGDLDGLLGLDPDFLVPDRALAPRCMQAFATFLAGPAARAFDGVELRSVRETSTLGQHAAAVFPHATCTVESGESHLIELPERFESYQATLKPAMLKDVLRRERGLQTSGRVEFCPREQLSGIELDEVGAIHTARQSELSEQGHERLHVFETEAEHAAFMRLLQMDAGRGLARHYLLKVDGATVAFSLGFASGGTVVGHTTAFAPSHRKFGLGRLIVLRMLEAEIEQRRSRSVDMGKGTTQVKLDFGNRRVAHLRITWRNGAWSSRLRFTLWGALARAVAHVRAWRRPPDATG